MEVSIPTHDPEPPTIPSAWFHPNERTSIAFYEGDAIRALLLEAPCPSSLHSSLSMHMRGNRPVPHALGLEPDLNGLCKTTGLDHYDLADVLGTDLDHVAAIASGDAPLSCDDAVALCRSYLWPYAILFRSSNRWHERTWLAMRTNDDELPF